MTQPIVDNSAIHNDALVIQKSVIITYLHITHYNELRANCFLLLFIAAMNRLSNLYAWM